MSDNKIIYGDNFETNGGRQYIAKDNAILYANEGQQVSVEKLLALLHEVKQELANLPVPETVKQEVEYGIQGAVSEAEKSTPDRKRIATRLRDAVSFLEDGSKNVKAVIAFANTVGTGISWCGEQWTNWVA